MNKEKVTLEITIDKAWWLNTSALIQRIQKELEWPLATGGCSIVSIQEKQHAGLEKDSLAS